MLDNDASIDSSFSAKIGDKFIVSQSGKAHMNFGAYKPGGAAEGTGVYDGSEYSSPGAYSSFVPKVQAQEMRDPYVEAQEVRKQYVEAQEVRSPYIEGLDVTKPQYDDDGVFTGYAPLLDGLGRPVYVPDSNPNATNQLVPVLDAQGRPVYVPDTNPNATNQLVPVLDAWESYLCSRYEPFNTKTAVPRFDKKGVQYM